MKITIEAMGGQFCFECAPDERILYAALSEGLSMPYECATGTCGTCRGRITAGKAEIEWDAAPGFARLKREKGDILLCQARPTSDCALRVPAKVTQQASSAPLPRHGTGRVTAVRKLTHDVLQFDLALGQPMIFAAGQFVVLETPRVHGGRAYSMVNFGHAAESIRLVVKQKPDGRFCEWLFAGDVVGSELGVFGPLGRATFDPREPRNVLCIAGGSGIAGMLSILERAAEVQHFHEHAGHVFFGVRALADGFYLKELAQHAARAGGSVEITLALSHEAPRERVHPQFPEIHLAHGMVVDVAARAMAGRCDNVVAFMAGPPPMVDAGLQLLLRTMRVPRQFVRYDKFA
jgi:toluene monooxygenase electron transfer component